jgi:hypothetical protein
MPGRALILAALLLTLVSLACAQDNAPPATPSDSTHATTADKPSSPSPSAVDLTAGRDGKLPQAQMQQLFRVVADKDMENDKRQRDYTYIERQVQHTLDGKGNIKSTEIKSYEVLEVYGEQVQRLIAKDDKPLNAKDAAKEEEKIQKVIDKRKNESDADRRKREEKEEKEREDDRKFVKEVADAYNFTLVGAEPVAGRKAWIIDAEPRAGFESQSKEAKFLPHFRGRVWIDQGDLQLAKMDVECLDTVSWGLFLARFHKGSRFTLEQTRVNDEVWLPKQVAVKADVRLALVKSLNVDVEQSYRDYKKFRASSKIIAVDEAQQPK